MGTQLEEHPPPLPNATSPSHPCSRPLKVCFAHPWAWLPGLGQQQKAGEVCASGWAIQKQEESGGLDEHGGGGFHLPRMPSEITEGTLP